MPTLNLKEFRCVEETDEVGSDSPYFVCFIGHPGNTPTEDVIAIRKSAWDNEVDSGETWSANQLVAHNVNSGTLVLVALMEEDNNADIAGGNVGLVKAWMAPVFAAYGGVQGISLNQLSNQIRPEFQHALDVISTNDEIVGVARLVIPASTGTLPALHFYGDGGHYWARFTLS